MLDGAARIGEVVGGRGRRRPAGARHHRPRQHVRDPRLLQGVPGRRASSRSSAPSSTWPTRAATSARPAGAASTTAAATPRAARSSTTTSPLLAENERRLPEPHPARQPGVPRGLLLQAPGRLGAARRAQRGAHRHHRAASAATCCRRCMRGDVEGAAAKAGPAAGHLRARQPLRRAAGPRHPRAAPHQPAAARARQAHQAPLLATNDSHYVHRERRRRPRRPAVRADRVADERPRTASSSTATSTT